MSRGRTRNHEARMHERHLAREQRRGAQGASLSSGQCEWEALGRAVFDTAEVAGSFAEINRLLKPKPLEMWTLGGFTNHFSPFTPFSAERRTGALLGLRKDTHTAHRWPFTHSTIQEALAGSSLQIDLNNPQRCVAREVEPGLTILALNTPALQDHRGPGISTGYIQVKNRTPRVVHFHGPW